jgi:hypothetical protein
VGIAERDEINRQQSDRQDQQTAQDEAGHGTVKRSFSKTGAVGSFVMMMDLVSRL